MRIYIYERKNSMFHSNAFFIWSWLAKLTNSLDERNIAQANKHTVLAQKS